MQKWLMGAALLAAIGTTSAHAADTALIMWNSANPGGAETATGTGSADLTSSSLNGVTITLSFVNRGVNPNSLTTGQINIDNTTSSVETLNIIAGANGYTPGVSLFALTGTIGVTSGQADIAGSFFVDPTNTLNGQTESVTGTSINTFDSGLLTGPFSFSKNETGAASPASPYGMAEELSLTLQPGASVFVQGASMTAIPEPSTWAMLAAGFGLIGLVGVGRRSARFAV